MTASCMTCIYSQLTKEQYPCSECYYDNNGNPSKHEPVVEAPDINVGNIDTTTHDSIPAETGKNDGDRTSGDCISRQAVTKFLNDWLSCLFENCHKQSVSDLKMIIKDFKNLPSIQSETNCSEIPNNSDTISRQAAIDALLGITAMRNTIPLDSAIFNIKKLPSAQPKRKTGRWIPTASGKGRHECSRCHEYAPCYQDGSEHLSTFCVLCGAKM